MIRVSDASVMRALDALLDGRVRESDKDESKWLSIHEIMDSLTMAFNENPVRFSTKERCPSTYGRWAEFVEKNQRRGYTIGNVVRVLSAGGYQMELRSPHKTKLPNLRIPVWGPR